MRTADDVMDYLRRVRHKVLLALDEPRTEEEIAALTGIQISTVRQQLRSMRRDGTVYWEGKWIKGE